MLLERIKSDIKLIFFLFLIWRLVLFLIAHVSPLIIREFGATFPYWEETLVKSNLPQFVWSFGNFDGVHYLRIAQNGYVYQYTQAFFPLYPILIKIASTVTFGNFLIPALVISNVSFLAALLLFYKLIKKIYNQKIAFWSCLFLLTFPTSFYFGSVYTEGIFFLMIISAFYLVHLGLNWQASVIGVFASATRLIGLFLAIALAIPSKKFKKLMPLLIVPIGFLLYVLYLKVEFNNPLYFLTAQSVWGQERSATTIVLLPQVLWRYFKILSTTSGLPLFNAAFELGLTTLAILLLIMGFNKIKKEWSVFAWIAILLPTLTGTLASMPRYVLVAFPIYIVLAHIKSSFLKTAILFIFAVFLAVSTILFARGYWVA